MSNLLFVPLKANMCDSRDHQRSKIAPATSALSGVPTVSQLFISGGKFPKPAQWLIVGLAVFSAFDDLRGMGLSLPDEITGNALSVISVFGYFFVMLAYALMSSRVSFVAHILYLIFLYQANSGESNIGSLSLIYVLLGLAIFSSPIRYAIISFSVSTVWCMWWGFAYGSTLSQPVLIVSLVYVGMTTSIALVLRYISVSAHHSHLIISATEETSRLELRFSEEREKNLKEQSYFIREELSRELHDVIGHQITSIAMQANLALMEGYKEKTQRQALVSIAAIARQALADMRTLVSVMKESGDLGEGVGATDLKSFFNKTLLYLSDLDFKVEGHIPDEENLSLPLSIEKTAVAILREGATNIVKHAPAGSRCLVSIDIDSGVLNIQMRSVLGDNLIDFPVSGFGLDALKQRVEAVQGRFYAGPTGSWWVLKVEIKIL